MLRKENAPPLVSAKFYKAIMQSVLLYGSKTWVLSKVVLAPLEGFHIRAAYKMAKIHVPCRAAHRQWIYPLSDNVLKESEMHTIQHSIDVQRETIVCHEPQHLCRMQRGKPTVWFSATAVVVHHKPKYGMV